MPTNASSVSSTAGSSSRNRARRSSRPTRTSRISGKFCRRRRSFVDHIGTFKRLAQLYAAVRNAYADKVGFVADLAYKTRQLGRAERDAERPRPPDQERHLRRQDARSPALGQGLGRGQGVQPGSRACRRRSTTTPMPRRCCSRSRIVPNASSRTWRTATRPGWRRWTCSRRWPRKRTPPPKAAKETGLSPKAFAAFWALRDEAALKTAGIDALELAKEIEKLLARFPNVRVNADEHRQLRAALYRPLISLAKEPRTRIVDRVIANLLG